MKYEQVWEAVDKLAKINGLSPSGLAKKPVWTQRPLIKANAPAPTEKKVAVVGQPEQNHWSLQHQFWRIFALAGNENEDKIVHSIPYVECSRLLEGEKTICIDFRKNKWQRIRFPDGHDNLYALDINTDQFAPFYRNGTLLILSQESEIRRGDRIAVFMSDNSIVIREFVHRTATTLELKDVLSADKTSVNVEDIRIVHRIVWASQ